jgi:hypothetical protein
MPPIAGYFINRAADADAHARMMGVFRDVFRTQIENLLGDATGLMESIAADHAREGADTSEMRAAG